MNNFKGNLNCELERDAPFTAEIQKRILHRQKKTNKKSMRVVVVASFTMLILFMLIITNVPVQEFAEPTVPYASTLGTGNTVIDQVIVQLKQNEVQLQLVEEALENQTVVAGADVLLNGRFEKFNGHPLVMEQTTEFERGDYVVLVNSEGEQIVRQLFAFSGEQYEVKDGSLNVNDTALLLPGTVSGHEFKETIGYLRNVMDFNYVTYDEFESMPDAVVAEDMLLVQEFTANEGLKLALVEQREVLGKVVAIQKIVPTFVLQDDERIIYDDFKSDYSIEKLVGLDPIMALRMLYTAVYEHDIKTSYALIPSTVRVQDVSLADFADLVVEGELFYTDAEYRSLIAFQYNGIENGVVSLSGTKRLATITFDSDFKKELQSVTMRMTLDGVWEQNITLK